MLLLFLKEIRKLIRGKESGRVGLGSLGGRPRKGTQCDPSQTCDLVLVFVTEVIKKENKREGKNSEQEQGQQGSSAAERDKYRGTMVKALGTPAIVETERVGEVQVLGHTFASLT